MVTRKPAPDTLSGYSREVLTRWLEASCVAQGVPVTVRDPRVIADVATLLRSAGEGGGRRRAGPACG